MKGTGQFHHTGKVSTEVDENNNTFMISWYIKLNKVAR